METTTSLWSPLRLNSGVVLRNRFVMAPMTTDSSHADGSVSDAELSYIRRRATAPFAASITSCAYVSDDGKSWQGIGAVHDKHLESLRRVAAAFHARGSHALLQIYDGGRIARPNLVSPAAIRAPSPIASSRPGARTPREMNGAEIDGLLTSFGRAAEMAKEAGFDGVEVHGANHYMVHQFFSPRSNQRHDKWGGSGTRRMRFPLAVAAAVRDAVGSRMTVGFRITPFESEPGGYTLEDSTELSRRLSELEVDYVHISMDDFRRNSPQPEDRDWTKPHANVESRSPICAIAQAVDGRCAVIGSGGITSQHDAEEVLRAGANLVAVGRAALIDPEWIHKIKVDGEGGIRRRLPADADDIERTLTIPQPMVRYLLSRPGWIPQDPA